MLLLQASLTTRPSRACPTPSLPIVYKGGMPTRIQQHGSLTPYRPLLLSALWEGKVPPPPASFGNIPFTFPLTGHQGTPPAAAVSSRDCVLPTLCIPSSWEVGGYSCASIQLLHPCSSALSERPHVKTTPSDLTVNPSFSQAIHLTCVPGS